MKKTIIAAVAAGMLLGMGACSKKYTAGVQPSAAYASSAPVCMGIGHDGSQILRVWGRGVSESAAINQAMKNAVYEVIFKGIPGGGECNKNAIVTEVNARERYSEYFDAFFSDGGEWKKYVTEQVGNKASRLHADGSGVQGYGIVVSVDRTGLMRQLQEDHVLPAGARP